MKRGNRPVEITERGTLGQFEGQLPGVEPSLVECANDLFDQPGIAQLNARQIDIDRCPCSPTDPWPGCCLTARFPEDPSTKWQDQPGVFGDRHKRIGTQETARRMLPTNQS